MALTKRQRALIRAKVERAEAALEVMRPAILADEADARDLIADLLHLIKWRRGDPLAELATAKMHYEAERAGDL